ncbi:DMT family transporter [Siminovitchia acidinfaciens]|uniref:DMT family transporter n=1 Tax=Siminovitchia acidinfaciens TaxID=2321395 RepID=UPI0019D04B7A|nr:DMT family transporter [Siminovitchia acidinfaciens]
MTLLMVLVPIIAGVSISVQAAVNGSLGAKTSSLVSAALSFFTGATSLAAAVVFLGNGDVFVVKDVPAWQLLAAVCGILFITIMVYVVPKIGVTAATVTVIIGQLIASLAIDHFGWFLTEVNPFGLKRLLGVICC